MGLRNDGGHAENGTGVEIGGGVRLAGQNVSVEAQMRTLLAQEETGYEEWDSSFGSFAVSPGCTTTAATVMQRC